MADEIEILEEQAERLKGAVRALMALHRPAQERLNRALALFARVFKYEPQGPALGPYQRIYGAIGDPPVGTTLAVPVETLSTDEQDALVGALLELHEIVFRTLQDAVHAAGR